MPSLYLPPYFPLVFHFSMYTFPSTPPHPQFYILPLLPCLPPLSSPPPLLTILFFFFVLLSLFSLHLHPFSVYLAFTILPIPLPTYPPLNFSIPRDVFPLQSRYSPFSITTSSPLFLFYHLSLPVHISFSPSIPLPAIFKFDLRLPYTSTLPSSCILPSLLPSTTLSPFLHLFPFISSY